MEEPEVDAAEGLLGLDGLPLKVELLGLGAGGGSVVCDDAGMARQRQANKDRLNACRLDWRCLSGGFIKDSPRNVLRDVMMQSPHWAPYAVQAISFYRDARTGLTVVPWA